MQRTGRGNSRTFGKIRKIFISCHSNNQSISTRVKGQMRVRGISTSSIAQLMRRGAIASSRYKGLVAARVPGKRNQYSEFHRDQHYLFAYRREFSVMFESECAVFSSDDTNKIKVGALAVSKFSVSSQLTMPQMCPIIISLFQNICLFSWVYETHEEAITKCADNVPGR